MTLAKYIKICAFILMLSIVACSEESDYGDYIPSSQREEMYIYDKNNDPLWDIYFEQNGELQGEVNIVCVTSRWEIESYPDWITSIEPMQGESGRTSLKITASPNSGNYRSDYIYINHIGKTINNTYELFCQQVEGYIKFEGLTNFEVPATESTQQVHLRTNLDDITISSDKDWCVASYDSSKKIISLSIQANPGSYLRTAIITVSSPSTNISERLTITQAATGPNVNITINPYPNDETIE